MKVGLAGPGIQWIGAILHQLKSVELVLRICWGVLNLQCTSTVVVIYVCLNIRTKTGNKGFNASQ